MLPSGEGYEIRSAGLRGLDGQPAHRLAIKVTGENNVELDKHRARTIDPDLLMKSDLILTMEQSQKEWIESRMPWLASRVHMMDRAGEQDIPDPIGGTYDDFKQTYEQLNECISAWLPSLQTKHAG